MESGRVPGCNGGDMNRRERRGTNRATRPITTKRDYQGASDAARRLSGQAGLNLAAEQRLQALLQELDKFDGSEEDAAGDDPDDYDYSGSRRRWSDDDSCAE